MNIYRPSSLLILNEIILSFIVFICFGLPLLLGLDIITNNGEIFVTSIFGAIVSIFGMILSVKGLKIFRSLTVSNHAITGVKLFSKKRTGFRISDIDTNKSDMRNIFEKLLGQQVIHSKSGDTILFYRRIFPKEDVKEILLQCNLRE